jgi:membrane protein
MVLMKNNFFVKLLSQTFQAWIADRAFRMAGALAYYSLFSMAPLLLIVIGVATQVFEKQAARTEILNQVQDTVGLDPSARDAVEKMLDQPVGGAGVVATVIGLVVLLFGASGVFAELQDDLNTIWKVQPKPGLGIWAMIRDRLLSFTVVLGTGFLLLVSLVVSAALSALGNFLDARIPGMTWLWHVLNLVVSFAVVTLLFAMIYKVLPDAQVAWRDVWVGSVVTALLFTVGKALIGIYIGKSGVASSFGAAGSLVVLLVWVYYSAVILLLGAEFTHAYALATRRHVPPTENAQSTDAPAGVSRLSVPVRLSSEPHAAPH